MLVYVESAPISVVNAPDEAAENLLLDLDAFGRVQLHELRELSRMDVIVTLLNDHHSMLTFGRRVWAFLPEARLPRRASHRGSALVIGSLASGENANR